MQRQAERSRRTSKYSPHSGRPEAKPAHIVGSDVAVERLICLLSPHSKPTPTNLYSKIKFGISMFYVLKQVKSKIILNNSHNPIEIYIPAEVVVATVVPASDVPVAVVLPTAVTDNSNKYNNNNKNNTYIYK